MDEPEQAQPDVPSRIRAMRNARDFARLQAEGPFEHLDADALEAVLDVFARENRKKPWRFWTAILGTNIVGSLVLSLLVDLVWKGHAGGMGGVFAGASMGIGAACASTRLQRRLAVLIASLDDLRVIGPLTDALDRQEQGSRAAVVIALKRMLPRLDRADAGLLSAAQRRRLGATLASDDSTLASAALDALVRIGDTSCYERVERLADGKGLAKKHADLWEAAKAALPDLQALKEKERLAEVLLRPAAAPADATLLRPADGTPHSTDAALLRPAEDPAAEVEAHG